MELLYCDVYWYGLTPGEYCYCVAFSWLKTLGPCKRHHRLLCDGILCAHWDFAVMLLFEQICILQQ